VANLNLKFWNNIIVVNEKNIKTFKETDADNLLWNELEIDVVLNVEYCGQFEPAMRSFEPLSAYDWASKCRVGSH